MPLVWLAGSLLNLQLFNLGAVVVGPLRPISPVLLTERGKKKKRKNYQHIHLIIAVLKR